MDERVISEWNNIVQSTPGRTYACFKFPLRWTQVLRRVALDIVSITKCLQQSQILCTATEELVHTSHALFQKWLHFRTTFGGISKHKIQSMADTMNIHGIWRMVDDTLLYASIVFSEVCLLFSCLIFLMTWLGGPRSSFEPPEPPVATPPAMQLLITRDSVDLIR